MFTLIKNAIYMLLPILVKQTFCYAEKRLRIFQRQLN